MSMFNRAARYGLLLLTLIYLGVANTMPSDPGRRLVADIGGGSTEIIIGEGQHPKKLESLHMGCVSMSSRISATA